MFSIARYKDLEKREFEIEVVTPLFLGGADSKKADLRVPSIKGAMRFWWRSLYSENDLNKMAARESEIFGSTEKKSLVSIKIGDSLIKSGFSNLPQGKMVPVEGKSFSTSIINYLAYGLFEYKRETKSTVYSKEYIQPAGKFKIILNYPKNIENETIKALKALVSFGGLGARSRNGFGSLYCPELIDYSFKKDGNLKTYTAFSGDTILFDNFQPYNKWEDALSEIGVIYREARLGLEQRHTWDKRAFIAMPIEAKNERIPLAISNGRHAKPYFLHVNKTPEGKYQGHILFLPYLYKTGAEGANRVKDYSEVCGRMNDEINKRMGVKK
ncbi:MAG: type III-B CRISPR module RAMP protein Cmr1 [Thermodesulfobacteriota bacterium]